MRINQPEAFILTALTNHRMLHPPVCGPGELEARQAGFLTFPQLLAPGLGPRGEVECLWDLVVRPNKQINFQVRQMRLDRFDEVIPI